MNNEVLDANEKERLRRKVRQERILRNKEERLSKITKVLHPESVFDEEKGNISNEGSSKIKEFKRDDDYTFQKLNESRNSFCSEGRDFFKEESLSFSSENFPDTNLSTSISFFKNIFFENTGFASLNQSNSTQDPVVSNTSEKWREWIHFVSTIALLFKIVLSHTKFLGTVQDRLTYSMEQPVFYYFMMVQWILHSIWLLLQTVHSLII